MRTKKPEPVGIQAKAAKPTKIDTREEKAWEIGEKLLAQLGNVEHLLHEGLEIGPKEKKLLEYLPGLVIDALGEYTVELIGILQRYGLMAFHAREAKRMREEGSK